MNRFRGALPDVVFDNIIVIYTKVKYREFCQCNDDTLPIPILAQNMFYIQNPMFSLPLDKFLSNPDSYEELQRDWRQCMKEYKRIMKRVFELPVHNIQSMLRSIRDSRERLQIVLHGVSLKIEELQTVQMQLDLAEKMMKNGQLKQEQYKNFTQEKTVKETLLVDAPYHSTICRHCNVVCHDHCGLSEIKNEGSNRFKDCLAFSGANNCTVCADRCPYTHHYHARKTIKVTEKRLNEVLKDVKVNYDAAIKGTSAAKQQLTTNEAAKKAVEHAIDNEIKKLETTAKDIMKYCSGFNLANELRVTMTDLEYQKSMMKNLSAMSSADKFIKTIKRIVDGMEEQNTVKNSLWLDKRKADIDKADEEHRKREAVARKRK
jgi:Pyruvate/2-oxoacid:ferredoxin oxidoreductase delta subunit